MLILILLCILNLSLGSPSCSIHFDGSNMLKVERFSQEQKGIMVNEPKIMLDVYPEYNPKIESSIIFSSGIIPGKQHKALVLKLNYVKNSLELEVWEKRMEWFFRTVQFPPEWTYDSWTRIWFTYTQLFINNKISPYYGFAVRSKHPPPFFFFVGYNFTGSIDELSIWDTADAQTCSFQSNLLLYLPFDECCGTVVADRSPSMACGRLKYVKGYGNNTSHKSPDPHRKGHHNQRTDEIGIIPFWLQSKDFVGEWDWLVEMYSWFNSSYANVNPSPSTSIPIPDKSGGGEATKLLSSLHTYDGRQNWQEFRRAFIPFSWNPPRKSDVSNYCDLSSLPAHVEIQTQCPYIIPGSSNKDSDSDGDNNESNGDIDDAKGSSHSIFPFHSGEERGEIIYEEHFGFALVCLFAIGLFSILLCICCLRPKKQNLANEYHLLQQVEAQNQVEPGVYHDYEYDTNFGYSGSYIPDEVQMSYIPDENQMTPPESPEEISSMMVCPVQGHPNFPYPFMPYYSSPYMTQQPWQPAVYPVDIDLSQLVQKEED